MNYNKYRNQKFEVDGVKFDSIRESNRYKQLKLLLFANKIRELKFQPRFTLLEAGGNDFGIKTRKIEYVGDFSYCETDNPSQLIVEDVKGFRTDVYKLKIKFFLNKYSHIKFIEI